MGRIDYETETFVAHALKGEGFDASEDGTGRGVPLVPVVFDSKGTQVQVNADGASPTLRSMNHDASHQNGGGQLAVAYRTTGNDGCYETGDVVHALNTATDPNQHILASRSYVAQHWAVRRLTPLECTRLQGFPDDYFSSARLNKPLADGNIYKMLGNSFAVNVVRWIGDRIETVNQIAQEERIAPVE